MAVSSLQTLVQSAIGRWGPTEVRAAETGDAVDGRQTAAVFEPHDVATLADMLSWANSERLAVVPRGGGTKMRWGTVASRVDVVLSTACLAEPIDHCAGDLTATIPAGASLAAANEILGRDRQWLALDPPNLARATIGGIVATNDSGPRRHRFGTPRDLIIGIEMALVDGRLAKAGGKVVKNVAGYDLGRLLSGSFGSLAVITRATFKLAPTAPASRTLIVSAFDAGRLADLALTISAAPLTPSAIDIESPGARLLVRFESTEGAATRQAAIARDLSAGTGIETEVVQDEAETRVWQEHEDRLLPENTTLARLAVLPTQVKEVLEHVGRVSETRGVPCVVGGRAALGVLTIALGRADRTGPASETESTAETIATVIDELRRNVWARGGSLVIRSASPEVKALVDVWGDVGDGLATMKAVKARFDPNRVLNPNRGPGGL